MEQELIVRTKAIRVGRRYRGFADRDALIEAYKSAHLSYQDGTSPRAGKEAGHELHTFLQGLVGPPAGPPPDPAAPIRYTAMTSVPEEWIPFIPVHVPGSTRETQLQRAAMPRFLDDAPPLPPPEPVEPRTPPLRQNLPDAYFIHEEEVPRAGVRITQCFQRFRRPDGTVLVWYGARKGTGRGEGSSGLGFDRITPTEV